MTQTDLTVEEIELSDKRVQTFFAQLSYQYHITEVDDEGNKYIKDDAPTEEEWRKLIDDLMAQVYQEFKVEYLFYIFHDRDVNKDGSKKALHVHILVRFKNPAKQLQVMKRFGITRAESCRPARKILECARYMIHITDKARADKKFIYAQDEVQELISEFSNYESYADLINERTSKKAEKADREVKEKRMYEIISEVRRNGLRKDKAQEMITELYDDEDAVSESEKALQHSDILLDKAYNAYVDAKVKCLENGDEPYRLTPFYITGQGGSGKTTLARSIAYRLSEKDVHIAASYDKSKTFDFSDGYKGQKASVLEEITHDAFGLESFLSTFDNYHYSPVSSRNNNKAWFAEQVFFSSSTSFDEFRNRLLLSERDRYAMNAQAGRKREYLVKGYVDEETNELHTFSYSEYQDQSEMLKNRCRMYINLRHDAETIDKSFQIARRIRYMINIEKSEHNDDRYIYLYEFNINRRGFNFKGCVHTTIEKIKQRDDALLDTIIDLLYAENVEKEYTVLRDSYLDQNVDMTFEQSYLSMQILFSKKLFKNVL